MRERSLPELKAICSPIHYNRGNMTMVAPRGMPSHYPHSPDRHYHYVGDYSKSPGIPRFGSNGDGWGGIVFFKPQPVSRRCAAFPLFTMIVFPPWYHLDSGGLPLYSPKKNKTKSVPDLYLHARRVVQNCASLMATSGVLVQV